MATYIIEGTVSNPQSLGDHVEQMSLTILTFYSDDIAMVEAATVLRSLAYALHRGRTQAMITEAIGPWVEQEAQRFAQEGADLVASIDSQLAEGGLQ